MGKVDDFINSLSHEAAPRIYDPVKAHEYYIRTRKLKGRRSASNLKSQKAKEGWAYVQNQVSEQKKAELKSLSEKRKADLQKLRDDVANRRVELSLKLKTLLGQKLGKDASDAERARAKVERQKLADELKSSLDQAKFLYAVAIEGIRAKYESTLDSEYNALKSMKRR